MAAGWWWPSNTGALLGEMRPIQGLCRTDPSAGLTQEPPGPRRTCERQRKSFRGGWASVPGRPVGCLAKNDFEVLEFPAREAKPCRWGRAR